MRRQTISEALRSAVDVHFLTHGEGKAAFARRAGVDKQTITAFLSSRQSDLKLEAADALAQAIGTDLGRLKETSEPAQIHEAVAQAAAENPQPEDFVSRVAYHARMHEDALREIYGGFDDVLDDAMQNVIQQADVIRVGEGGEVERLRCA